MRQPTSPLHPKSRFTTSLFATTVFASFFVVLLPHILPCPAPRNSYLDDGTSTSASTQQRRRRRRVIVEEEDCGEKIGGDEVQQGWESGRSAKAGREEREGREARERRKEIRREMNKRACPVPKPSGLVGEILGFNSDGNVVAGTNSGLEGGNRDGEGGEKMCPIPKTASELFGFKKVLPPSSTTPSTFSRSGGEGVGPP